MSANEIINIMKKLSTLHESLLGLSKQKTELLKNGQIDSLQAILVNERKHVQGISKIEEQRSELTKQWFEQHGLKDAEQTVSVMIEYMQDTSLKSQLEELFEKLVITLAELKQQEQLNRDLTQTSLQFVELNLDLIDPSIKNMNYGNKQEGGQSPNRSVFDSKA